jgi:hypothetical protein
LDRAGQGTVREVQRIKRQIGEILEAVEQGIRRASMAAELERLEGHKASLQDRSPIAPRRFHPTPDRGLPAE